MIVHLIDGTYELFRHFYGSRRFNKGKDLPFGAVTGVLNGVLQMIEKGGKIGVNRICLNITFCNYSALGSNSGKQQRCFDTKLRCAENIRIKSIPKHQCIFRRSTEAEQSAFKHGLAGFAHN